MESCAIVIQQEQALLVLVHIKLYFLDECNLLLLQEAPAWTVMLQFRVLEGLILAVGGWRRWVRQPLSGRVRHLENAEPAADLLVPGEWPILPLVLLHHVLGAVDIGNACASLTTGLATRSGLGDSSCRVSGCWFYMVRRHSAQGGGIGAGRGC